MRPDAGRDDGFSLLEVMVALAVFSLGALALLNVMGESQRSQAINEARAVARIVAENRLVEAMATTSPPPAGASSGREEALGRIWFWEMNVAPSPDPRLLRIDVLVHEDQGTQTLAELSTFRGAGP
jgi:general secretion pathway protein I